MIPHESKFQAIWHPRDPEPSNRQEDWLKISRLLSWAIQHFINLRLRDVASLASITGSNCLVKSYDCKFKIGGHTANESFGLRLISK